MWPKGDWLVQRGDAFALASGRGGGGSPRCFTPIRKAGTRLSSRYGQMGAVVITGLEMLKGLDGLRSHQGQLRIPIVANDQYVGRLADQAKCHLEPKCLASW